MEKNRATKTLGALTTEWRTWHAKITTAAEKLAAVDCKDIAPCIDITAAEKSCERIICEMVEHDCLYEAVELIKSTQDDIDPFYTCTHMLACAGEFESARRVVKQIPPKDAAQKIRAYNIIAEKSHLPSDVTILRALVECTYHDRDQVMAATEARMTIYERTQDIRDLKSARKYVDTCPISTNDRAMVHAMIGRRTHAVCDVINCFKALYQTCENEPPKDEETILLMLTPSFSRISTSMQRHIRRAFRAINKEGAKKFVDILKTFRNA